MLRGGYRVVPASQPRDGLTALSAGKVRALLVQVSG